MTRPLLLLALLSLPLAGFASSFAGTSAGSATGASSGSSASSSGDDKVVQAARDDAAAFVASDGQIRGARLQAALVHLREQRCRAAAERPGTGPRAAGALIRPSVVPAAGRQRHDICTERSHAWRGSTADRPSRTQPIACSWTRQG
jgi:uncharacterized protein (TIGR02448 family)